MSNTETRQRRLHLILVREEGCESWWGHGGHELWETVAAQPGGAEATEVVLFGPTADLWLRMAEAIPGWDKQPIEARWLR